MEVTDWLKYRFSFVFFEDLKNGPDNLTSQLLSIMSNECCSGDGEGRKDKGGGGEKMVCDKDVCVCVKDGA